MAMPLAYVSRVRDVLPNPKWYGCLDDVLMATYRHDDGKFSMLFQQVSDRYANGGEDMERFKMLMAGFEMNPELFTKMLNERLSAAPGPAEGTPPTGPGEV